MAALLEPSPTSDQATHHTSAQRIVLTGFMGAGKSTVGRLLAATLGWQFIDIDAEVEEKYGRSIAEIFAEAGEAAFRRRESAAIARAMGRRQVVIALGGGAPETAKTAVVFLDAPFAVLFNRCVLQEGAAVRPVLLDAAAAAERFRTRVPLYRRCAQHHIVTAEQRPEETAQAILALLSSR